MQKILLIEDDLGIVRSLRLYLEESGFAVEACQNGNNARIVIEDFAPDLIVLDLNLPGKNGMDICRELRQESSVPVIVLSARSGEADKVGALELGADDYVEKPFSPRETVLQNL